MLPLTVFCPIHRLLEVLGCCHIPYLIAFRPANGRHQEDDALRRAFPDFSARSYRPHQEPRMWNNEVLPRLFFSALTMDLNHGQQFFHSGLAHHRGKKFPRAVQFQ